MAKAGVEATFPVGPVSVETVVTDGLVPFSATFTADEIGALLNVYPFESKMAGLDATLSDVEVAFPQAGVAVVGARLVSDGTGYSIRMTLPLEHTPKGIDSPGATELSVEGFSVGGTRRQQASDALVAYLNLYLGAAPGLIVERASIVEGGLVVDGSAPQRLEHPPAAGDSAP